MLRTDIPEVDAQLHPDVWCEIYEVFVLDEDGWRNDNKSWDDLLSQDEFVERMVRSTIMPRGER